MFIIRISASQAGEFVLLQFGEATRMDLGEAVGFLGKWSREELRLAIEQGVELPSSRRVVLLRATPSGKDFDISEADLDGFIGEFHAEDPGRWPPVRVRRELLIEAAHRCAICEDGPPLQYHHILEYNRIKHYDTRHMLAICGTCHHRCTLGMIDRPAQVKYKERLAARTNGAGPVANEGAMHLGFGGPARFSWDDLHDIVVAMHSSLGADTQLGSSQFDFSDVELETKNQLNSMGDDYFAEMRANHEPYFGRIRDFLANPANQVVRRQYFEVVDELRSKIATDRPHFGQFEQVLTRFADIAVGSSPDGLRGKRRALNILLSYMYFNCDIGRKT